MLHFNSASLRYKFIYLTKNVYHGIAVHTCFAEAWNASLLNQLCEQKLSFNMIDKYINFIPFSLRFERLYREPAAVYESDIILPTKRLESKWITFTNILFFVDMCDPEQTAFLYISPQDAVSDIEQKIAVFLRHCAAVVSNDKKMQCSSFSFPLRDQQIVFHILAGRTVKEIAAELSVTDKMVYKVRDQLTRRLESQQSSFLFQRLGQCWRSHQLESYVS